MTPEVANLVANSDSELATRFDEIFARLKQAVGAQTDIELGTSLGLKQQTISTTKRRKQLPAIWITRASLAYGISSDWILYGTGSMRRGESQLAPESGQKPTGSLEDERRWMSAEAAPELGYELVPKVRARLCAGTGSLETEGEVIGLYAFKREFLKRKGHPKKMVLMDVVGDSMEPEIFSGDTVLIDESQREIISGGLFAVGIDSAVLVKYVDALPGKLSFRSRNERYNPIEVDMAGDLANMVRIIGRVVWSCREYVR
ncbi:helix-turn-helix domain-containing protein [Desulfovibrio sp. JY]|nr:helix-turn-helix domain-containing protein [Desulfovibrio sp. JY]